MISKIKNKIDNYLGFDSNEIFLDPLIKIFGGAIRDCIAGYDINDIDIICAKKSSELIGKVLEKNGYVLEDLISIDMSCIYSDLEVISYPQTWIKQEFQKIKKVQIILPRRTTNSAIYSVDLYKRDINNLISNVDISCCGVSYDGKYIYENYPNAINHCINNIFKVNQDASMLSKKRILHRINKLESRGWIKIKEIRNKEELIVVSRDQRIGEIVTDIDYIKAF